MSETGISVRISWPESSALTRVTVTSPEDTTPRGMAIIASSLSVETSPPRDSASEPVSTRQVTEVSSPASVSTVSTSTWEVELRRAPSIGSMAWAMTSPRTVLVCGSSDAAIDASGFAGAMFAWAPAAPAPATIDTEAARAMQAIVPLRILRHLF